MATFTLLLDTRVKKKNDQYNLSIRVISGSEQIYLNISQMTKEQYNQIFVKKTMDKMSISLREKSFKYYICINKTCLPANGNLDDILALF